MNTFNHEGPAVVSTMHGLTSGVFEILNIISPMDVDQRLAYNKHIMIGAALKKYKAVLLECKQSVNNLLGDKWTHSDLKGISTDNLCTWIKIDGVGYDGDNDLGIDKCVDFKKKLWFELVKLMRRKHQSVFNDHLKYIHNEIVKPFRVIILHYAKRVEEIHYLEKHLPPRATVMKQLIGKSATKNSLFMIFELLLRTDPPHPYRMS